jgi:hypothetical protein
MLDCEIKSRQINVRLTESEFQQLKELAIIERKYISDVVRMAIINQIFAKRSNLK